MTAAQLKQQQHDFSYTSLTQLYSSAVPVELSRHDRYVVFADLHMGDGGKADDFVTNAGIFAQVLQRHYLDSGFKLVLNGDVEELQRFPYDAIRARWKNIYRIFDVFYRNGDLYKLSGNHDMGILRLSRGRYRVVDALRLSYNGESIFVFHGHQVSRWFMRHNRTIGMVLKYIATPLRIKNYEVSHNSRKRFETERLAYEFASRNRILTIIGHTHRPLFESMSKVDSLKFEVERLCRAYPEAAADERQTIEQRIARYRGELLELRMKTPARGQTSASLYAENLVVPCLFNSGCVIGKRGITALEIADGFIRLVYWFDRKRSSTYLTGLNGTPQQSLSGDTVRTVMKEDRLDFVLSRIRLLT
ncbi:MAG: metallophosphoesterase [Spirochaetaceae bacterium]|nr:MAG: metallophosphoesterase [Spirochaetaceae bacterium]